MVGPHAVSQRDLMEDYKGDQECFGGGDSCVRTIGEVFTNFNGPKNTQVEIGMGLRILKEREEVMKITGVEMDSQNASGIPAALAAIEVLSKRKKNSAKTGNKTRNKTRNKIHLKIASILLKNQLF